MRYAEWTRHKALARGFPSHEDAIKYGRGLGNIIGHSWRVEPRRNVDVQTGIGRQTFIIHNYGTPVSLYLECVTTEPAEVEPDEPEWGDVEADQLAPGD